MLFHIGRIAIITFLTVLALRPFIAIDPVILVLLISVMCIIYTWMGGIEGVIWTDVIQGLLLSGSAILIFIVICLKVQGGIGEIFTVTQQADKFFPATQFHWSWTESTVPVLMIGFLFANIQQFTASQDVVQRYIVTDSIEETKKTLLTNAKLVAVIPVFFFCYRLGIVCLLSATSTIITGGIQHWRHFALIRGHRNASRHCRVDNRRYFRCCAVQYLQQLKQHFQLF